MPSERFPLPYLGHNNRELGLMLRGTKPLAYFLKVPAIESDTNIRYWRMFERHVAAGRLIRREVIEVFPDPLERRSLFFALPGHEWRIDAMRTLMDELHELKAWSEDRERRSCELLGYEGWQIDHWMTYLRARAAASTWPVARWLHSPV